MSTSGFGTMTSQQRQAAEMIGRGYSRREAADAVGVSLRTIGNWLDGVDGFRALAQEVQKTTPEPNALAVLRDLLTSKDESIRLRAAEALLRPAARDAAAATEDRPAATGRPKAQAIGERP
jgi:HEAT repeat protein